MRLLFAHQPLDVVRLRRYMSAAALAPCLLCGCVGRGANWPMYNGEYSLGKPMTCVSGECRARSSPKCVVTQPEGAFQEFLIRGCPVVAACVVAEIMYVARQATQRIVLRTKR